MEIDIISKIMVVVLPLISIGLYFLLRKRSMQLKFITWGIIFIFPYSYLIGMTYADIFGRNLTGFGALGLFIYVGLMLVCIGVILIIIGIVIFIRRKIKRGRDL